MLVEDSKDEEVATVVKCYSIGDSGTNISKAMNKLLLPPLKKCAVYLHVYTDITDEADITWKKAQIIKDIISRINSLLRELCGICGIYYNNERLEIPIYRCVICKQGCHNVCFDKITTLFNALDENQKNCFPFMCTSCLDDNKDGNVDEITVNAPKNTKSPKKPTPVKEPEPEDKIQPDDKDVEVSEAKSHDILVIGDNTGDGQTENRTVNSADADEDPEITRRKSRNKDPTVAVCPGYKWGMCKNYDICEYRHPPRCYNWLSKGKCKYGDNCRYHHPPLCLNSLQERRCLEDHCKFFHITNTIRPNTKRQEEQLKSSLHANAYRTQQNQQPRNRPMNNQVPAEFQYQQTQFPPLGPRFYPMNRQPRTTASQNQPPQSFQHQPPASQNKPPQSFHDQPPALQNQPPQSFQSHNPNNPQQQPPQQFPHQEQTYSQRQQPLASEENHFLYEHIKETNATMKDLKDLISGLLNGQIKSPLQISQSDQLTPQIQHPQATQQTFQLVEVKKV